ncbi:unnamed protein product [Heligmosomoides polygyrus]|uniref:Protein-tyrosine-phosphatase n=1 Tax=Heligmosomoides polygyrus TaxID=6339 RepID=A0A183F8Y5_HELPZ|nr:unnamed protein product [Heligmosomoides polygyrus]
MSVSGKEDVYESEDLPESEQFINSFVQKSVVDSAENENVELIHLDIDAARKRFKDRTLNTREIGTRDILDIGMQCIIGMRECMPAA